LCAEGDAEASDATPAVGTGEELKPLFQELIVTNVSQPKKLLGALVYIFKHGERAADLVLVDPRYKHLLMYTVALVPEEFQACAQLLIRRRDRRLRVRVLQHFRPKEDETPEVFRIAKSTNITALGTRLMKNFVDWTGNNLNRTVKLQFAGKETASMALMAMEQAVHKAYRELAFIPRFVEETHVESDAQAAGKRVVSMLVTVTAT